VCGNTAFRNSEWPICAGRQLLRLCGTKHFRLVEKDPQLRDEAHLPSASVFLPAISRNMPAKWCGWPEKATFSQSGLTSKRACFIVLKSLIYLSRFNLEPNCNLQHCCFAAGEDGFYAIVLVGKNFFTPTWIRSRLIRRMHEPTEQRKTAIAATSGTLLQQKRDISDVYRTAADLEQLQNTCRSRIAGF
jgi:hypothetical protein